MNISPVCSPRSLRPPAPATADEPSTFRVHAPALAFLVLLVFCWLRTLPWSGNALWGTHDKLFDVQRASGVISAWQAGYWDARWCQTFDAGYGYPIFFYYAPLFHWISGALTLVVGQPSLALEYNIAAWLAAGTLGTYLAGNAFWQRFAPSLGPSTVPGLVAACGWLMSPYPMCNVFVRGALSEFASSQMLPWIVYMAVRQFSAARVSCRWVVGTATVLSLSILSHNFLGMCAFLFFALLLAAYLLKGVAAGRWKEKHFLAVAGAWCVAGCLALLATTFFWMPSLLDRGNVHIQQILLYKYSDHFLYWTNLRQLGYWNYGGSDRSHFDTMPLHLGYVSLAASASGVIGLGWTLYARQWRLVQATGALLAGTILAILCTTWISKPLWDAFPLLQFGQFPWRLLSFGALGFALLLPSLYVSVISLAGASSREATVPALLLILFVCSVASEKQYGRIHSAVDITPETTEAKWQASSITTTERDEYRPIWSAGKVRGHPDPWTASASPGLEAVPLPSVVPHGGRSWRLRNLSGSSGTLTVAVNYFPGWQAWDAARGKQLAVVPEPDSGFVRVTGIEPGRGEVYLRYGNTRLRRLGNIISLMTLLALVGWNAGRSLAMARTFCRWVEHARRGGSNPVARPLPAPPESTLKLEARAADIPQPPGQ